jgi:hypothetical protein
MAILEAALLAAAGVTCSADVRPAYAVAPDFAASVQIADAHVSGVVKVRATVSSSGSVTEVSAEGSPFLTAPSITAARQWKFVVPEGSAASCAVDLRFRYVLIPPDASSEDLGSRYSYPWTLEVRAKRPTAKKRGGGTI